MVIIVKDEQNAPFSIVTFLKLLQFTLDTYLRLLSVKQGSIK